MDNNIYSFYAVCKNISILVCARGGGGWEPICGIFGQSVPDKGKTPQRPAKHDQVGQEKTRWANGDAHSNIETVLTGALLEDRKLYLNMQTLRNVYGVICIAPTIVRQSGGGGLSRASFFRSF